MNDFQIVLISDSPYHLGLIKGYCHAHRYKLFEAAADVESIYTIIKMQPNIVIVALEKMQELSQKTDFKLIRELSITQHIPVCCLRDINHNFILDEELTSWVDSILEAPLDINQLDAYLRNRFKHHPRFIQEKRNRARRAAIDRRLLILEQQNPATASGQSAITLSQTGSPHYFMLDPFQIDQRSKCVLFKGKSLNLTRKEFDLFELLAKDVDRVFMTEEIINHVWPENNRVTKSDLYQYMHLLRKKIENDPNHPQWILTVKGFGYKLNLNAPS